MPIRLNLLAEAQAAEEMRRRDPVKRAAWVAGLIIVSMLAWSSLLQARAMIARSNLSREEGSMKACTNAYLTVLENKKKVGDIQRKVGSLALFANSRFLHAPVLNALQQASADDVQLAKFRVDQSYALTDEVKAKTIETRTIPGRPATVTEKIVLTVEANDASPNPGDQVNKFKETIANIPYFRESLGRTNVVNLKNLSQPVFSSLAGPSQGKPSVLFTLESRFPEKTR